MIVVNGHGGNYVLANVVQRANTDGAMCVGLYPSREDWTAARRAAGISSSNYDDMHAGELETSIVLASHSAYVRDGWHTTDHAASDRRYLPTLGIDAYTTSGVIGYPSEANADKGHAVLSHLGQAAAISSPCSPSSDPLQLRRGGYRPLTLPSAATHDSRSHVPEQPKQFQHSPVRIFFTAIKGSRRGPSADVVRVRGRPGWKRVAGKTALRVRSAGGVVWPRWGCCATVRRCC
jgi:Creatinine amidohydrolase